MPLCWLCWVNFLRYAVFSKCRLKSFCVPVKFSWILQSLVFVLFSYFDLIQGLMLYIWLFFAYFSIFHHFLLIPFDLFLYFLIKIFPLFHFLHFLKRFYLFLYFLERRAGKEKEGKIYQRVVASCTPPAGDLAHNPDLSPDWEQTAKLWFAGWHSIHWATPARARYPFLTSTSCGV